MASYAVSRLLDRDEDKHHRTASRHLSRGYALHIPKKRLETPRHYPTPDDELAAKLADAMWLDSEEGPGSKTATKACRSQGVDSDAAYERSGTSDTCAAAMESQQVPAASVDLESHSDTHQRLAAIPPHEPTIFHTSPPFDPKAFFKPSRGAGSPSKISSLAYFPSQPAPSLHTFDPHPLTGSDIDIDSDYYNGSDDTTAWLQRRMEEQADPFYRHHHRGLWNENAQSLGEPEWTQEMEALAEYGRPGRKVLDNGVGA
ncbi:hypothetical protein BU26DRAFT_557919 [Trematosphaeria pertusa]|uniref:Uncharacterized protein n=1 Tax=Trematosphaeria pertusa TaxID=390896 RepID=A0A6A6J251_9PLEO|nr:uncharacterized protein BU26DRAFT_557919 [Trematosphaeria pertusa]KAF2256471.1 hypothetical protein BU26DRAFT_557919 [Trematosphaeria pertusa]